MRRRTFLTVALATLFFIFLTSFDTARPVAAASRDNTHYYWYLNNGTTYDGWYTTSQEISRLEMMYGVYVDGNPLGGTLIASGYSVKGYPHYIFASQNLYSH